MHHYEFSIQTVDVFPSPKEGIRHAANYIVSLAKKTLVEKGICRIALSGGSTPITLFSLLATEHCNTLDWNLIEFFWSDERCVPPNHPDSNYGNAMKGGLSSLAIASNKIHRIKGELPPKEAAAEYQSILDSFSGKFDLILLGMGDDGHTASLFPGSKAIQETKRLVSENWVESKQAWRITFTYPLLERASHILFLCFGKDKAHALSSSLHEGSLPAGKVGSKKNKSYWITDAAAASLLD